MATLATRAMPLLQLLPAQVLAFEASSCLPGPVSQCCCLPAFAPPVLCGASYNLLDALKLGNHLFISKPRLAAVAVAHACVCVCQWRVGFGAP